MKWLPTSILLAVFTLVQSVMFAQNETKKWYFGAGAGLDFTSNPPIALTNGTLVTYEGCASIADGAGNLLFYTDGVTVYNQAHVMMANGNNLFGSNSTSQAALIIRRPGSNTIYFIFTLTELANSDGFRYSVVDMSLAAGMGSVTSKNNLLYTPSCEKLTATKHCNGTDVWVVTHDFNSAVFRSHLVTAAGVSATPVLSTAGPVISTATLTVGQMKISPQGRKLGLSLAGAQPFGANQLYDFDPATGIVSNFLSLGNTDMPYGCEFSADGSKFYSSRSLTGQICQWNLRAGSASAIVASLYTVSATGMPLGSFQLAPNGKIYIARWGQQMLGTINSPNLVGAACNYSDNGQSVSPNSSNIGLPNFVNSFFKPAPTPFSDSIKCQTVKFTSPVGIGNAVSGCLASNFSVSSLSWNFGDPVTGAANSSTLSNPTHVYSGTGTFTSQLIINHGCNSDTLKQLITITQAAPILSVTGNYSMCVGESGTLVVTGADGYSWTFPSGAGPATSTVVVSPTVNSTYSVTGTNTTTGCSTSQVVSVAVSNCTGLEDSFEERDFQVYPNPFGTMLNVVNSLRSEVTLTNYQGRTVILFLLEAGTHQVDVSYLPPGIYFLKTVNGKAVGFGKLVKPE